MPVLRSVLMIAAPAFTALIGLLWFTRRKKDPAIDLKKPPDKSKEISSDDIEQVEAEMVQSVELPGKKYESEQCITEEIVSTEVCSTVSKSPPSKSSSTDVVPKPTVEKSMAATEPEDGVEVVTGDVIDTEVTSKVPQLILTEKNSTLSNAECHLNNNVRKSPSPVPKPDVHMVGPHGDHSSVNKGLSNGDSPKVNGLQQEQLSTKEKAPNARAQEGHGDSVIQSETVVPVPLMTETVVNGGCSHVICEDSSSSDTQESSDSQLTNMNAASSPSGQGKPSGQEGVNHTESYHCDKTTAEESAKTESVEAEVSHETSEANSTNATSNDSKSPISTPESDDQSEVRTSITLH